MPEMTNRRPAGTGAAATARDAGASHPQRTTLADAIAALGRLQDEAVTRTHDLADLARKYDSRAYTRAALAERARAENLHAKAERLASGVGQ